MAVPALPPIPTATLLAEHSLGPNGTELPVVGPTVVVRAVVVLNMRVQVNPSCSSGLPPVAKRPLNPVMA
jgi:hypothetical protein